MIEPSWSRSAPAHRHRSGGAGDGSGHNPCASAKRVHVASTNRHRDVVMRTGIAKSQES